MFDDLTGLGYGLITFAIVIGVGSIVLHQFGGSVAECGDYVWNTTHNLCCNATADCGEVGNFSTPTGAWVPMNYLNTQLGTAGLAGWTPAIIALTVGMLFLGMFLARKGKRRV